MDFRFLKILGRGFTRPGLFSPAEFRASAGTSISKGKRSIGTEIISVFDPARGQKDGPNWNGTPEPPGRRQNGAQTQTKRRIEPVGRRSDRPFSFSDLFFFLEY
ncbi:MAG: hypothetical protein JSS20_08240 [Proteobacteria bacterium]|nr:hypothetical protein [Pseudomonadota bacterium]